MNTLLINKFTIPTLLVLLLIILRFNFSYLAFHAFAEYFAVFVGFGITLVTYYTYAFTKNRYLLFIGLGYFWVAVLDILHTQTYTGMHLYAIDSSNTTLSFWVLNRLFEASILFLAPFMRNVNFSILKTSLIFALITILITTVSMNFPLTLFVEGQGLTQLKVSMEYLVVAILLATLYVNKKHADQFQASITTAITFSIILTIVSELAFTLYSDMYGIMNVLGHILKFLSFWILLQAIIKTSLSDPFSLMQKGASTYNAIPLPALVVNDLGIIKQVNQASCMYLNKSQSEIIGQSNHTLFHPSHLHAQECPICIALSKNIYLKEYELYDQNTKKHIEYTLSPVTTREETKAIVQVSIDTTHKHLLQKTLEEQLGLLENIINTVPIRIFWKDTNGVYLGANDLFVADAKLESEKEIIGKNDFEMVWGETEGQLYRDDDLKVMQSGEAKLHFEETQTDENGKIITLSTSKVPLKDMKGNILGILGTYEDITDRKYMENKIISQTQELEYQANYDGLTHLPNRFLFQDRLQNSINKASRHKNEFALLFIDLDQFKQINDSLGHDIGDEILIHIAQRLKNILRKEDSLARLGGDEFTIIVHDFNSLQALSTLAQKIIDSTSKAVEIGTHTLYVSASVGIALYPKDTDNADALLQFADAAMYKAKDEGRNNFQYYSDEMTHKALQRVQIQTKLKEAIKNKDFIVYYQPQIDIKNNTLIGLEALVRWRDSNGELIYPDTFIPLAEETGMIVELDRIVMKIALQQVEQWKNQKLFDGVLSVNLAMKQLQKDDFVDFIKSIISSCNCEETCSHKRQSIELELTESGLMQNPDEAIAKLNILKDLGINIVIDDFGTGYSSLAYLKKLPISKIKIDRSFVNDIPHDEDSIAIIKAIIALSQSLDLEILAEGVETQEQNDFMRENNCHIIQGYFHAKPMSSEDMKKFLQSF